MNEGASWGPACWENVTGLPPSDTFKAVAAKRAANVAKDRKRKATTKEKIRRNKLTNYHRKTRRCVHFV